MEPFDFLQDIAIEFGVAIIAALIFAALRLPLLSALIIAGVVAGPLGLGLIRDTDQIGVLDEVGVILLLFTIGLEFSFHRMSRIASTLFVGGSAQVLLTVGGVAAVGSALGMALPSAVTVGFLFALSSTAIVLKSLADRAELEAPHGRFIVGVLIFQDLCVVPMMLITKALGEDGGRWPVVIGAALVKAAVVIAIGLLAARTVVPWFFRAIARLRSREMFVLAVSLICLATGLLTHLAGLSMALGAFLAGVALAESEVGKQALGEMRPLRDIFTTLFFISLGMLFDYRAIWQEPMEVAIWLGLFVVGKGAVATVAALWMGFPARASWLAGIGLAQFGEFGFVLAGVAQAGGLLAPEDARNILCAGAISMIVTPFFIRLAPNIRGGERILRRLERRMGVRGIDDATPEDVGIDDHVIIVGFGIAGRMLARALREVGARYLILELNLDRVREFRPLGEPIYFGDITSPEAMRHASVERARALAILINDPGAAARAVDAARREVPHLPVFTRAKYLQDRETLRALGADEVVVEEVEAGIEMLSRVLRFVGAPRNILAGQVRQARASTLPSERSVTMPRKRLGGSHDLAELKFESFALNPECHAVGRTLRDLDLGQRTGVLAVALKRSGRIEFSPSPRDPFRAEDVVYLVGARPAIRAAAGVLETGEVTVPEEPPAPPDSYPILP